MKNFITALSLLVSVISANAQNITNTLGTGGLFKLKDGMTTFLSVNQTDGLIDISQGLKLVNTNASAIGVIYKGTERFLHNYQSPGSFGGNTFLGINAGNFTMSGVHPQTNFNTGLGYNALTSLTTGYSNTGIGFQPLFSNTTGRNNIAIGNQPLYANISGILNVAIGDNALISNTTGYSNNAIGYASLTGNTTGYFNIAIGTLSQNAGTTALSNTSIGAYSMFTNTTGSYNTVVGSNALYSNTTGANNTAIGYTALYDNTTGSFNTSLSQSLTSNTTGSLNTALGYSSLATNTSGTNNTAVGYQSLTGNINGFNNTGVGYTSLHDLTSGDQNTAIGSNAAYNLTTGNNVTCIGYNSQATTPGTSNQVVLGNNSITSLRCNVTTITSLSDARDKKNIHDLNLGLNFISKLKPRIYNWDKREWYDNNISDGTKMQEAPTAGFIAQELDEVQTTENAQWLNLVLKDNPEKWEATPGNLLPVMVKAIQELNEKCDSLQNENDILAGKLNEIGELKEKLALITSQIEHLNNKTDELKRTSGNNKNTENNIQVISNENTK